MFCIAANGLPTDRCGSKARITTVQQQWPVHLDQRTSSGRAELDGDPAARPARRAQGDARQPPPRVPPGLRFNEHITRRRPARVRAHVQARLRGHCFGAAQLPLSLGTMDWIKSKNPDAPAVRLAIPLSERPPSQRLLSLRRYLRRGNRPVEPGEHWASTACHFALVWVSVGHAAH